MNDAAAVVHALCQLLPEYQPWRAEQRSIAATPPLQAPPPSPLTLKPVLN
ncbi:MAG: hypothetical protein R2867_16855 [Caldilineaceae bacterium]